jgi:hypothetical protein
MSGEQMNEFDGMTLAENETETDEATSADNATQTAEATLTENANETDEGTSTTDSASQQTKRADTPATHRPLVPGPLGVFGPRMRERLRHGDADVPTSQTAGVTDPAATAGPSSVESS